jgi:hypothetical protein
LRGGNRALTPIFLFPIFLLLSSVAQAQQCGVIDPELRGSYAGPCVNGLAEGQGTASGTAEYRGEFKAGRKNGKGTKTWPNGDRYQGEFVEDRKEGVGAYTWGRGPWQNESYEGSFLGDRRHGFGVYRYATGDVYAGPWERDLATGPPTPMMQARAKFEQEARAAVAKEGRNVCREMQVGIGGRDWIRGVVVAVAPDRVAVRIDDPGKYAHVLANVEARQGDVVWDVPQAWTPCF